MQQTRTPPTPGSSSFRSRQKTHDLKKLLSRCSYTDLLKLKGILTGFNTLDFISKLPSKLARSILIHLSPQELCQLRLVCKKWNIRATDNALWRQHCIAYSILPDSHTVTVADIESDVATPIYHDLFRRALTAAKNWTRFNPSRYETHYEVGPVLSLLALDSTHVISGDIGGVLHVWDARRKVRMGWTQAHEYKRVNGKEYTAHVVCLARNDNLLASGSADATIALHTIPDFQITQRLEGHEGPVTAMAFGGPYLFSGSRDKMIRMWDVDKGTCLRILCGQDNVINTLLYIDPFSPSECNSEAEKEEVARNEDGWLLSGSNDRSLYLWDMQSFDKKPQVTHSIMETHGPVTATALYAEWQDDSINPSSLPNDYSEARKPLSIPPFVVCASQFDTTVTLTSLPTLSPTHIETPIQHGGTIWAIVTAPIHSKVITVSGDRTVQIWDLKSPRTVCLLDGFDSAVTCCSLSPQEDLLCFGTEYGTLVVYNFQEFA